MKHPLQSLSLSVALVALGIPALAAACPDYKAKNAYASDEDAREAMENMKRGLSRLHPTDGVVLPSASQDGTFEFKLTFQPKSGGRCPVVTDIVASERFKTNAEAINALSLAVARASSSGGDVLAVDAFVFCESSWRRCGYSYAILR